jgi:peroxiredoxin
VTILLLASAGIIFALLSFNQSDENVSQPQVGQAAPNFSLTNTDEKKMSLQELRGKVVVVNFWGTWCDPCREEMPRIQLMYEKYKDNGVVVVGVNIGESRVTAKGFADRLGLTFPIVLDHDRSVTLNQYKIGPIPTSFFIDKQGVVRYIYTGPMSSGYLETKIQTLLSQP